MNVNVRPIFPEEEQEWNRMMESRHPLGNPHMAGHRLKYVAEKKGRPVALASFSACSYHLADRDRWIGWSPEQAERRRLFVLQNSRFLVLPCEGDHRRSFASRILGACARRLSDDWVERFGYPVLLLETFVDPAHNRGTSYKASGWVAVGRTRGFRRDSRHFYCPDSTPKDIWLRPLRDDAKELLKAPELPEELAEFEMPIPAKRAAARLGVNGLRSLYEALGVLPDDRRPQGRRYPLSCCLAIITCGVLAGCSGVRECAEMAAGLPQAQLRALRSWRNRRTGRYEAPGATTLWRTASAVDPDLFEKTVRQWFRDEGRDPDAVALDGKVLKATLQNEDGGSCVVSAVSHQGAPFFFDQIFTESKGKEIGATQKLISRMPEMPDCVLTLDAVHAVGTTFETVIDSGADFLVCVKNNASDLRKTLVKHLNRRQKTVLRAETFDNMHGRQEMRSLEMAPLLPGQTGWPHTHVACRVTRWRRQIRRGETVGDSEEQVIYVGSFAADRYSPDFVLSLIRGHWGIENGLHHRKDRSMDEDRCRSAAEKTGRVMCCLRSIGAMVFGRTRESLRVVQRRLSTKPHLLIGLFSCRSLQEWERKFTPYKLKPAG